jgi:hypothetical protein
MNSKEPEKLERHWEIMFAGKARVIYLTKKKDPQ